MTSPPRSPSATAAAAAAVPAAGVFKAPYLMARRRLQPQPAAAATDAPSADSAAKWKAFLVASAASAVSASVSTNDAKPVVPPRCSGETAKAVARAMAPHMSSPAARASAALSSETRRSVNFRLSPAEEAAEREARLLESLGIEFRPGWMRPYSARIR